MDKKFKYVECFRDKHGVDRVYAYTEDNMKVFVNIEHVLAEYERLGIKDVLKRVV